MKIQPSPDASLQQLVDKLADEAGVVGASVAVFHRGTQSTATAGHAHLSAGISVTPHTLFQIGSITKVYTATLVAMMAARGLIDTSAPIRQYVPEFRPRDEASQRITVQQLLTHTSGLDGDFWPDTGRGDDCLEKMMAACAELKQLTPPGLLYGYCNIGFVLLGRLVENVTTQVWDTALRQLILEPVGLHATVTLPEEVLLHPAAIGHLPDDSDDGWRTVTSWSIHRSMGPAGIICATAADVAAFGSLHFRASASAVTPPLLAPSVVAAMQRPLVGEPDLLPTHCGLAWHIVDRPGGRVLEHSGGNMGQGGKLTVAPDHELSIAVLINGARSVSFLDKLIDAVLEERAGIAAAQQQASIKALEKPLPLYTGTYVSNYLTLTVSASGDHLAWTSEAVDIFGSTGDGCVRQSGLALPFASNMFVTSETQGEERRLFAFSFARHGDEAAYVTFDGRLLARA